MVFIPFNAAPYCATPLPSLYRQIKKYNCTAILCQDYEHARFDTYILLGKLLKLPVFATFQGGNWQMSYGEKWIRPFTIKACKGLRVASGVEAARLKENTSCLKESLSRYSTRWIFPCGKGMARMKQENL